jgi:O-Antigen ligase
MGLGWRYKYRSPQGLTGIVVCAVMLGCGRWGAKIGVAPLYIGDLLLAVAAGHMMVSWVLVGPRTETGVAERAHPGLAVGAFIGWSAFRFLVGAEHGWVALRDFAPYGYALVAFLSANAYTRSNAADRGRTLRFIEVALVWHLLWVIGSQLLYGATPPPANMDESFSPFVVRGDDGGVLGITACLFLLRYLRHGGLLQLLVTVASLGSTLAMASRGALLATLMGLALTVWFFFLSSKDDTRPSRQITMAAVAPVALFLLVVSLPNTTAGSKLLVSVGLTQPESHVDVGGLGTEQARSAAWERVLAYTGKTLSREVVGVGFGPHFMMDSGASIALIHGGDPSVRSPHNYFVSTYARLGILGIMLLALVTVRVLTGMWRIQRYPGADDLLLLAMIVPLIILVEAAVGATLEAPFGAIPFFWFLGILLSKPILPTPAK